MQWFLVKKFKKLQTFPFESWIVNIVKHNQVSKLGMIVDLEEGTCECLLSRALKLLQTIASQNVGYIFIIYSVKEIPKTTKSCKLCQFPGSSGSFEWRCNNAKIAVKFIILLCLSAWMGLICSLGPPMRCPLPLKRGVHLMEVMLLVFYKRNDWNLSLVSAS